MSQQSQELKDREDADESQFWLTLLVKADLPPSARAKPLVGEATELTAIFTASLSTSRQNRNTQKP
jgi:hypothetical protein